MPGLVCPTSSVPPNSSDYIKALYSCKDSVTCVKNTVNHNDEVAKRNLVTNKAYDDKRVEYNAKKEEYVQKLDRWEKRIGEYEHYETKKKTLSDEKRIWVNCTLWDDARNRQHDDYCVNDFGPGWYHSKIDATQGVCLLGSGQGVCKRTDARVMADLDGQGYTRDKPIFSLQEPIKPTPEDQLTFQNINIQCCVNYLGAGGDAIGNTQICEQEIIQKLNNSSAPPPVIPPPVIPPVNETPAAPSNSDSENNSTPATAPPVAPVNPEPKKDFFSELFEDPIYIGGAVLIIILLFFSSSAAIAASG